MKVISVVSVVLLAACAVSSDPLGLLEDSRNLHDTLLLQNRKAEADYESLGCYSLRKLRKQKVILKRFKRVTIKSSSPLEKCIQSAKDFDYPLFGIKKSTRGTFRCLAVKESGWDFNKNKAKTCKGKIGSRRSIFIWKRRNVSEIDQKCILGNKSYSEGEQAEMPQPTDNLGDAKCKVCTCLKGEFSICLEFYCDAGLSGCEELHHPPGQCCPSCKPSSCKASGRKLGDKWRKRVENECFNCECHSEDQAICTKVSFHCPPVNCKEPIVPEGKCCPEPCETVPPFFTVRLTTATPTKRITFPWER